MIHCMVKTPKQTLVEARETTMKTKKRRLSVPDLPALEDHNSPLFNKQLEMAD